MLRERIQSIFREVFDDENLILRDDLSAKDVANWNSLNHINLILRVEEEFGLQFQAEEIAKLANVGEFLELLRSYGVIDT
jgi:acyl carrier protein